MSDPKDVLFILQTDYADPAHGHAVFYCEHCVLLEGVLAAFPKLAERIEVRRLKWPRPRTDVLDLLGEDNQNLPALVLYGEVEDGLPVNEANGLHFVNEKDDLLEVMARRYGISRPHP
ncbi:DUF3088 family protein [Ponticaulis koreensis]|uniref:DUF3088 family protein n=1 Tax=Ponticaulis koreensis TaxID=1123045 RepID=UPI0004238DF6|nr:DUF3088 family protein [Ponticaulis koreensis]